MVYDLRYLPTWLSETLTEAHERDIQIVLCPNQANLTPAGMTFDFETSLAPHQPPALILTADDAHAVIHSDPAAVLHRQRAPEHPTQAARKAAAGIAWERILATRVRDLAAEHDTLRLLAERWLPSDARIDLDLILADDTKGITWILDAKNSQPKDDQLGKMRAQIRLLERAPETSGGRPIVGVIIHHKRQLDPPIQATEHHNILRCTLQRLPDLLLAKRLPGTP